MTRIILLAGALALAATPVALPAPASAQGNDLGNEIVEICLTEIIPDPIFEETNLGRCVAWITTLMNSEDHGFPTFHCMSIRLFDPDDFYAEYDTFGECVTANK